jgi:hypothetical protein
MKERTMKVFVRSLVFGLLLANTSAILAQSKSTSANAQLPQIILGTCEDNISFLSNAHHLAGADGTIIAVARLGDGESNRELSSRRLHNVRVYLTDFGWHRQATTVITAEGERIKGYGRVELYVKGVPFAVLEVKRNQDLLVGSCEPDDIRPAKAERNLYPYLDRKPRKPATKP